MDVFSSESMFASVCSPIYCYKIKVNSCYDGDTIRADIDLGFGVILRNKAIRLFGIDTPEIRGKERARGIEVRDFVRSILVGKVAKLYSIKDKSGKYGRFLGVVHTSDILSVNELLLRNGMARPYPNK